MLHAVPPPRPPRECSLKKGGIKEQGQLFGLKKKVNFYLKTELGKESNGLPRKMTIYIRKTARLARTTKQLSEAVTES